jgi:hypothetical protein
MDADFRDHRVPGRGVECGGGGGKELERDDYTGSAAILAANTLAEPLEPQVNRMSARCPQVLDEPQ